MFIGTNFDIYTELSELIDLLSEAASDEVLKMRVERIVQCFRDDLLVMDQLVTALQSAAQGNSDYGMACMLIMGSATNILNAFNRVHDTAQAIEGVSQPTPVA